MQTSLSSALHTVMVSLSRGGKRRTFDSGTLLGYSQGTLHAWFPVCHQNWKHPLRKIQHVSHRRREKLPSRGLYGANGSPVATTPERIRSWLQGSIGQEGTMIFNSLCHWLDSKWKWDDINISWPKCLRFHSWSSQLPAFNRGNRYPKATGSTFPFVPQWRLRSLIGTSGTATFCPLTLSWPSGGQTLKSWRCCSRYLLLSIGCSGKADLRTVQWQRSPLLYSWSCWVPSLFGSRAECRTVLGLTIRAVLLAQVESPESCKEER